jgi:hypothetical protein
LREYDRETGRVVTKENRWGSAFRPTLSPDGKWLVYGTRYVDHTRLRVRNLATNEEEWLTGPVQRDDQESTRHARRLPGMSFTPDSKYLVTTWDGKLWKVAIDTKQATEIPFEAMSSRHSGPHVGFDYRMSDSTTFVIKQIRDAAPSPDGKKLAFVALDRLYVMDYPNGTPKRLTNVDRGEFEPTWSPDGQWIAYTTWDDTIGYLNRVRSDGSGRPQRLTPQQGLWTNPVYTPNGQRIVATRSPSRSFRIGGGGGGGAAGGRGGGSAELMWIPAAGGPRRSSRRARRGALQQARYDAHLRLQRTARLSTRCVGTARTSRRISASRARHRRVPVAVADVAPARAGRRSPPTASAHSRWSISISTTSPTSRGRWPGADDHRGCHGPAVVAAMVRLAGGAAFPVAQAHRHRCAVPAVGHRAATIHWSIGNAHVVYDVARAIAFDDSVRRANPRTPPRWRRLHGWNSRRTRWSSATRNVQARGDAHSRHGRARHPARDGRAAQVRGSSRWAATQVIEKGDIVVTDNRITAIGPSGTLTVPAGARRDRRHRKDNSAPASSTRMRTCASRTACIAIPCGVTPPTSRMASPPRAIRRPAAPTSSRTKTRRRPARCSRRASTSTGPGVFAARTSAASRTRARCSSATPILRHEDDQGVSDRQSRSAAVGHPGGE